MSRAVTPLQFAQEFAPIYQADAARLNDPELPSNWPLNQLEIEIAISGAFCRHGQIRILDCPECSIDKLIEAQCQKLLRLLTGSEMTPEDAEKFVRDFKQSFPLVAE